MPAGSRQDTHEWNDIPVDWQIANEAEKARQSGDACVCLSGIDSSGLNWEFFAVVGTGEFLCARSYFLCSMLKPNIKMLWIDAADSQVRDIAHGTDGESQVKSVAVNRGLLPTTKATLPA